jgi:hypothetical protein
MKYQVAADDVILRTYSGQVSDDEGLSISQVIHWLVMERNRIAQEYLNGQIRNGAPLDTFYQIREACESAEAEELDCVDDEDERIFLTLERQPLSLFNDAAVNRVLTEEGVMLNKARNESIDWIKEDKYMKPTIKNPVWYRDNKKIILEGVSYKNLQDKYIVYYYPTQDPATITGEDEINLSDELMPILMDGVTTIALNEIYRTMKDLQNDGQNVQAQAQQ